MAFQNQGVQPHAQAARSGFVYDALAYVVTNAHMVDNAQHIQVASSQERHSLEASTVTFKK
jgi:S1-C subfamily serine protease